MINQIERFKREKFITIRGRNVLNEETCILITLDEATQLLSVLTAMLRGKLVAWRLEDGEQKVETETHRSL